MRGLKAKIPWYFVIILSITFLVLPAQTMAKKKPKPADWCNVMPEPEIPSEYYDSILYSEIAPRLCEIEKTSDRVSVEVIGQSAGGRNLFLVTITNPMDKKKKGPKNKGKHKDLRKLMIKDPEKALEFIEEYDDFNVPVFINGSIHGGEYPGTDACMQLIEYLAYDESEEVQAILDNIILLINVVQNPDGRVMGTRRNANDIDINRDFMTQSQPETRATVGVITDWNPMVFLDLHGFVNPMLIEPCTPPHNPNYEYDLYLNWAYWMAIDMEAELFDQTGLSAQIPFRDDPLGWDDWPPIYAAMYPIYHGSYGHTIETSSRDAIGVDAHYAAVWGALKFVVENKKEMVADQIEVFRRGLLDLPQVLIPDELLAETPWEQFNEMTIQEFPAAYVIPAGPPYQISTHQAARLVDFLLFNDVQVEEAQKGFELNGMEYPKGTYIVWMDQPKRGLANTILDAGQDLSYIEGLYFYSPPSVWSQPYLWGADRVVMEDKIYIKTKKVKKTASLKGSVEKGDALAYAYMPTSIEAFKATNDLLAQGITLYRAEETFEDKGETIGAGAVIIMTEKKKADKLAKTYGLNLLTIEELPEGLTLLKERKIAVYGDGGVRNCLDRMGFQYDMVSSGDLNSGMVQSYDLFINGSLRWTSLNDDGRLSLNDWFAAGGDYIGLSYRGRPIQFAIDAGIATVAYEYVGGNAIVSIDYDSSDSVAAGFRENGYAFVYYPGWFSDIGESVEISASIDDGENFLVSGFWPEWKTSGAMGQPVIVHQTTGLRDVTLIGIDATFRGHPENTFRIVGNAIYDGIGNACECPGDLDGDGDSDGKDAVLFINDYTGNQDELKLFAKTFGTINCSAR
ncbi:MAG: M14 family zinc carboxypeptidase [Desulfobacterales bacterium]|nr:M14 family zinc carboxypeptidase [Desulfobacterales bacterium]